MRKNKIHTIITLGLGGLSMYLYFALIGVVKVMSMKFCLHKWIFNLPKPLQQTAYLLHNNFEELIVAVLILGSSGIIIGLLVENKPAFFGFMEFVGATTFYFVFHVVVLNGNFMWTDEIPIWSQVMPFISWFLICLCTPIIGNKIIKGRINRLK
jgi:hypothetical protein